MMRNIKTKNHIVRDILILTFFLVLCGILFYAKRKYEDDRRQEYLDTSVFYLSGNVSQLKEIGNHHNYIYKLECDSILIERQNRTSYFWGLSDTTQNIVYFLGSSSVNCGKIIIDGDRKVVFNAMTGEPLELIYVWSDVYLWYLKKYETENTIRF